MQCRARDRGPIVPVLNLLPFAALDSRFNCDRNLKRIRERDISVVYGQLFFKKSGQCGTKSNFKPKNF